MKTLKTMSTGKVGKIHSSKEAALEKRVKELESAIQEFVGIDVDEWEEYELKHLIKKYVEDFTGLLKKD